jgi:hypothetical protein
VESEHLFLLVYMRMNASKRERMEGRSVVCLQGVEGDCGADGDDVDDDADG